MLAKTAIPEVETTTEIIESEAAARLLEHLEDLADQGKAIVDTYLEQKRSS